VNKLDDAYYCCIQDTCCHFDDEQCNAGATCCLDDCDDGRKCSYTKTGCEGRYGQIHNCAWDEDDSTCIVGPQDEICNFYEELCHDRCGDSCYKKKDGSEMFCCKVGGIEQLQQAVGGIEQLQ